MRGSAEALCFIGQSAATARRRGFCGCGVCESVQGSDDMRLALARLCALDGRFAEATSWFAESRR
jgi:hypothetical protein